MNLGLLLIVLVLGLIGAVVGLAIFFVVLSSIKNWIQALIAGTPVLSQNPS
jgi:hypothetical protein